MISAPYNGPSVDFWCSYPQQFLHHFFRKAVVSPRTEKLTAVLIVFFFIAHEEDVPITLNICLAV